MGISYVVLGVVMGLVLTGVFGEGLRLGGTAVAAQGIDLTDILGFIIVPFAAVVGLLITTPIYLLFVSDKNTGLLEYLLAVGMGQRDIFWGYLKASFLLSLVGIVPMLLLNLALESGGIVMALEVAGLGLVTALADVALVTVLMTAFSSMQRKPTGMNSPVGISIGIFIMLPELLLTAVLRSEIVWLDLAVGVAVLIVSVFLLVSIDRLIVREKLLP
jgi:hypothetical protein